jgi:hypothetical protein
MAASPQTFVSGDLLQIVNRDEPGKFVPVKGPVITIRGFSGEKGSTVGLKRSRNRAAAKPLPPINL